MLLLADIVDGARCRLNDCVGDQFGRLISGSCFYSPNERYEMGKLIQIDNHGKPRILDEGFHLSNGLGFSPDGETLYFADSAARRIYAYDYDQSLGSVRRRRTLVEVPATEGLPDGLAVDAEGFIWSAQWYGGCVVRYDPDGRVERRLEVPAKQTTSIAFGGDDLEDIFVTSAAKPGPLPIMPPGYDLYSGYIGGRLYRTSLGIQGKAEYQARIETAN
jgi:D-xylonolactonase